MAKNNVNDWDTSAGANTDVGGISIAEGMSPSGVNNAMREKMAQWADVIAGNTILDGLTVKSDTFRLADTADTTKKARFNVSGITSGATAVYTLPSVTATLASLTGTETLSNKTLSSPVVTSAMNVTGVAIAGTATFSDSQTFSAGFKTDAINSATTADMVISVATGQNYTVLIGGTTAGQIASTGRYVPTQVDYIEMQLDSTPSAGAPYTSTQMTEKARSGFAAVSTNGRFNVPVAGVYKAVFHLNPDSGGTTTVEGRIERFNSSNVEQEQRQGDAAQAVVCHIEGIFVCDAGDYLTFDYVTGSPGYVEQESYINIFRIG